jgi:hypothetical protein
MGVPTVPVITQSFRELVTSIAYKKGIPGMRMAYTPHPVTDRPPDLCRKYIEGKDPVSGKPMLDVIAAGLTQPVSAEDKQTGLISRPPRPRLLEPMTPEQIDKYFQENGYTDGFPIIPPTEQRVAAMLKATSRKPDELVGKMRPSDPHEAWDYTVEMVASNAVMAGAKPEYFPAILAVASTGVTSLFSSTASFARMALFNGPVTKEIGMNSGIGAMGPFNHPNATIGRAWTLISKNLGGSGKMGETYLGSQGNPLSYSNICFPEAEDGLPDGWSPVHVQKGFKPSESVVSLFSGWSLNNIAWFSPMPIHDVIRGWLEHFFSTSVSQATLILDPIVAKDIAAAGYKSKEAYADYLAKNTGTPSWLYWQNHQDELKKAKEGVEPFAGYLKLGDNGVVPAPRFNRGRGANRSAIEIIVTGGSTNAYWFGGDFSHVTSASVDKWR